jgi:tetratricopeptide (TPR) repeat protein
MALLLLLCAATPGFAGGVQAWEQPLTIPTYTMGPPEVNPSFFTPNGYQGASSAVYPYPLLDNLGTKKEPRTYRALFLENPYVQISVLPEIGGRVFSALDKTNNYDFIYRQHVIKPALIGMAGAWISGGIEWNVFHHHRVSTYLPVDSKIEENADGSRTIWVGETDLRHRMKWIVGLTLHPDRSYIEARLRFFNRTPFAHTFLYWANPAVHANELYQVLFPPSTEWAVFHGKNQFTRWPISAGSEYNHVAYAAGTDLSWWKNHPKPTSFFAWNYRDDFVGGYDHGKEAGVMYWADHRIAPGKKFWEWGPGAEGRMWDRILTDTDGPYIEIMAGAYSDNQPDYSWIQPGEVKEITQYWYPIRGIGGAKYANLEGAVNLEIVPGKKEDKAHFGFNTTRAHDVAVVRLTVAGKTLFEQKVAISPAAPFVKDVLLPKGSAETDVRVALVSPQGGELIAYQPAPPAGEPEPPTVKKPFPAPREIASLEEVLLTGRRLEQFYDPSGAPEPYYEEVLRRDPGESRAHTALGILCLRRAQYDVARAHFEAAVRRLTRDHTKPRSGEADYYLGVTLRAQGRLDAALDAFGWAAWDSAFTAPAQIAMAEVFGRQGQWARALEAVRRAVVLDGHDTKALDLEAAFMRQLGQLDEALAVTERSLAIDPLDFLAANERLLARAAKGQDVAGERASLETLMRGSDQNHLELATDYVNAGFTDQAIDVLERRLPEGQSAVVEPLVAYSLADLWRQKGEARRAEDYAARAQALPTDYAFPFRLEHKDVLERAISARPQDSRASFYLGNLLYDLQPEAAIGSWEKAVALEPTLAIAHRNLGFAYARARNDVPKATAALERAVSLNPKDPRLLFELDEYYEAAGAPLEKRLASLAGHQETVLARHTTTARQVMVLTLLGRYDDAIELLGKRHFQVWEGEGGVHDWWADAHLLRGRQKLAHGDPKGALADFEAALVIPENIEVGSAIGLKKPQALYSVGLAQQALGRKDLARKAFEGAAALRREAPEAAYYQGLALEALGRKVEARALFDELAARPTPDDGRLASLGYDARREEGARVARERTLRALGLAGRGEADAARKELEAALAVAPASLGARTALASLAQ